MKAILVIDVDNIDIENTQATYIELQCNNRTIQMALVNHWLKPLPEYQKEKMPNYVNDYEYERGFNRCIDEILWGEQE